MINRTVVATIAIVTIILLTCAPMAAEAGSAKRITSLPFKGNAEGTIIDVLPEPAGVSLVGSASGHATHLGLFTREEQLLLNPGTGSFTGHIVFTAANGDQLWCTVSGNFISATDAVGVYAFIGGTGRFENATGEAEFFASLPDGVHYTVEFNGTIEW